ncbi:ABC transporter ATP-binding protein [Longispora albida]|uniref:ABC transporter ATP-binding protein n=1 Tax=Longispora albida TaxID=203523 RepID=UPI00059059D5|nr:ATP-binding cassette domain-containing protein [Longispora albida]
MIEVQELTKRYGEHVAVDRLSFTVRPGEVTGFLGPNGAGKSTTMRAVLGLDRPTSGTALVGGRQYREYARPLTEVGALLDAGAVHPGRTAFGHLHCLARASGIGMGRVTEVLQLAGLGGVTRKRAGTFSLGMRQRLGIAGALLGDPGVLLFDEPVNGLDPEGIRWIRGLLRGLAAEGRTVLVSSHLMSEMALTADRVVVIGRGRLIADLTISDLAAQFQRDVLVRTPDTARLRSTVESAGGAVSAEPDGGLAITGLDASRVGSLAAGAGIVLHELTPRNATLEEAYLEMTDESVEYRHG